jgi:hypothetical protein
MTVIEGVEHRRGTAGETVLLATLPHRPKRFAMIGLEPQPVIGAALQDLVGDRLLTAHGIQGHDAVFQVQRLEQHRNRSNLVRFAINHALAGPAHWPTR